MEIKNKLDKIRYRLILPPVICFILYVLTFLINRSELDAYTPEYLYSVSFLFEVLSSLLFSFLFSELSLGYSRFIFRNFTNINKPYRSLLIHNVLLFILNNITVFLFAYLISILLDAEPNLVFKFQRLYLFGIISTFVTSVYASVFYIEHLVYLEKKREELEWKVLKEKERAAHAQLISLKLQIDPHFMFNNFSILSELIEEDKKMAVSFLENLSKVYRYIIQNLDRTLISVVEELHFLDAYIYLLKIRYENMVRVTIDDELRSCNGNLPPAVLQLLVENAIKHNVASPANPLVISIRKEHHLIVVENRLNKMSTKMHSTHLGHKNIMERYSILSDMEPVIEETEKYYRVSLPILH